MRDRFRRKITGLSQSDLPRLYLMHAVRASVTFGGLAMLSACASSGMSADQAPSTGYFMAHAGTDYRPPGPPSDPWGPYITLASNRFDVPERWIREVMQVESGGHEYIGGQLTVSSAGAMGLMQLEPDTYQEMAARYGLESDPFNPYNNIMAGTAYIHEMYEVYGSPGFLAAYDAGPGRLNSFMNGGGRLPEETNNYIAIIAPRIQGYYPAHRSEADQLALNTMPAGISRGILPAGYDPSQPSGPGAPEAPNMPDQQLAAITPARSSDTAIYANQTDNLEPAPPRPQQHHFSIIPAAMADTPPPETENLALEPGHVGWAIQLGSYRTASSANAAIGMAELSAVQMLIHGHPVVVSYHAAGKLKYRARVVGLPHEDAINACTRLADSPSSCVVLSPEAQL